VNLAALSRASGPPRLLIATSVPSTLTAFLLPYAEHFRGLGWRVDAVSNGVMQDERSKAAFDEVHDIGWTRKPTDLVNLTTAPQELRALVRRGGYDLVHAHDPIAAFVTRYALRRLRLTGTPRVVYTAHGFHFYRGAPPVQAAIFWGLERVASAWTDRLVVINQEDLAAAQAFPLARRGGVVYMPGIGVDTSRYEPTAVNPAAVAAVRAELKLEGAEQLFTMIAEFNPGKRHKDAVAALAASNLPNAVLALAGVGPLMGEVAAQAQSLGVADRVKLLGYRQDIPALVAASTAVLLPSEREGLPRSLMEASSLERPVIATRIRGVGELVTPETGILHEVGDVAALANAMRLIAGDPELAHAMGRNGRIAMSRFDLRNVLALHEALYAELLAG